MKKVLKEKLRVLVEDKVSITQARLQYRCDTPVGTVGRDQRLSSFRWDAQRASDQIRYLGLAYAFTRGVSYWVTERRLCKSSDLSVTIIAAHAEISVEQIETWLYTAPTAEQATAWSEHLQRTAEKRAELRRLARASHVVRAA